jgi:hypothetical protein
MIKQPECLHIPNLYEEGVAAIRWQAVDGADGYELDYLFDGDFGQNAYETYRGVGVWSAGRGTGQNWVDLEHLSYFWQHQADALKLWDEIEAIIALGRYWQEHDSQYRTWQQSDTARLLWDEIECLPVDMCAHISHTIDIPLYKKSALCRVRAYKGNEESDYLTSAVTATFPRSLQRYAPPCMHLPILRAFKEAVLVWGDLYGAQGVVLERDLGDGFEEIYRGAGQEIQTDCGSVYENGDDVQHLAYTDFLVKTARHVAYRIKAYNSTDESQYFTTDILRVIPLFQNEMEKPVVLQAGDECFLQLDARKISDFAGYELSVEYDSDALLFERYDAQQNIGVNAGQRGNLVQTQFTVVRPGLLRYTCHKESEKTDAYALLGLLQFKALESGESIVKLY